jgi:hypothetical protein
MKEIVNIVNIELKSDGSFRKRVGWRTFEGMIYQLKLINKRYLKNKWGPGDYTVRLPLPMRKGKK